MIRRLALAALALLLLGAGGDGEPLDRVEARARIADGLYLESGMGDYRGSLQVYQELVLAEGVPDGVAAEAMLRMGLAREALDEPQEAEAAYRTLLDEYPSTHRAVEARSRLQSLEEDRKVVRTLPVTFDFDIGVGGLFHARSRSTKGRLTHEKVERGGKLDGIVAWETYVIGGEDDIVVLGFEDDLRLTGDIALRVHARTFPAHLSFFLVDRDGRRFGTTTRVVRPEEGWRTLSLSASDFQDRSAGSTGGAYRPRAGMAYLMIQDATGHSSTDRGENLILIDDLAVQ